MRLAVTLLLWFGLLPASSAGPLFPELNCRRAPNCGHLGDAKPNQYRVATRQDRPIPHAKLIADIRLPTPPASPPTAPAPVQILTSTRTTKRTFSKRQFGNEVVSTTDENVVIDTRPQQPSPPPANNTQGTNPAQSQAVAFHFLPNANSLTAGIIVADEFNLALESGPEKDSATALLSARFRIVDDSRLYPIGAHVRVNVRAYGIPAPPENAAANSTPIPQPLSAPPYGSLLWSAEQVHWVPSGPAVVRNLLTADNCPPKAGLLTKIRKLEVEITHVERR